MGIKELSLFTGAGGGLLGSKLLGWGTLGYVEIDDYCQRVIRQRIRDGILDEAPIFGNIETFISEGYADGYKGMVDIVTGGFPCQPFSVAGKQLGEDDPRNMWPATLEVIRRVEPRWCLLENVPGVLAHGYFGRILGELAESGYDARWKVISAAELGAPHKRDRLWIVADSLNTGLQNRRHESNEQNVHSGYENNRPEIKKLCSTPRITWWHTDPADVGDAPQRKNNERESRNMGEKTSTRQSSDASIGDASGQRPTQPRLGRVAHGVAHRVDRLKAIGNGQVPAVVRAAWELLSGS